MGKENTLCSIYLVYYYNIVIMVLMALYIAFGYGWYAPCTLVTTSSRDRAIVPLIIIIIIILVLYSRLYPYPSSTNEGFVPFITTDITVPVDLINQSINQSNITCRPTTLYRILYNITVFVSQSSGFISGQLGLGTAAQPTGGGVCSYRPLKQTKTTRRARFALLHSHS